MELISSAKGWVGSIDFDTQLPELGDDANIQDALKMFFFGDISSGNVYDYSNSLYHHLVSLKSLVDTASSSLTTHVATTSDTHGIGSGASVVGTTTTQALSNKTLNSPVINSPSFNSGGLAPVGSIMQFAGSSAPTGWLLCDGAAVGRVTYAALFGVVSTTYGVGDNSTTFNLPNLKGKVVVGLDSTQTEFDALAETGGAKTHTHNASSTTGSSGSHQHTTTDHSHNTADHSHNTADHSHYADHSHSVNPGSAATSSDSHSHSTNTNSAAVAKASSGNTSPTFSTINHTHNTNSDSHSHTVNIATFTSANANGYGVTTGGANAGNTTSGASAGNTTGGASDGNTTSPEGSHTHTASTIVDIDSSLQPYIVLNYIIKY